MNNLLKHLKILIKVLEIGPTFPNKICEEY